jgi:hypothetical protein
MMVFLFFRREVIPYDTADQSGCKDRPVLFRTVYFFCYIVGMSFIDLFTEAYENAADFFIDFHYHIRKFSPACPSCSSGNPNLFRRILDHLHSYRCWDRKRHSSCAGAAASHWGKTAADTAAIRGMAPLSSNSCLTLFHYVAPVGRLSS